LKKNQGTELVADYWLPITDSFTIFGQPDVMTFISLPKQDARFSSQNDEELLEELARSGNLDIVGELYRRYAHLVLGVCLKYLKDQENAHDATMQIFEKLISDLTHHQISNFKSWLYMVAKNYCLMQLRKEKAEINHFKTLVTVSDENIVEIWDELHLKDITNEKMLLGLASALTQLNQEQRLCVELIYLENKSYKEITDITGMDINSVKSHIQNGKRNLKILLEKIK
jgi:RNA polymerase sigma factor (sigma-70 family)